MKDLRDLKDLTIHAVQHIPSPLSRANMAQIRKSTPNCAPITAVESDGFSTDKVTGFLTISVWQVDAVFNQNWVKKLNHTVDSKCIS
jgi:hypothetical protein